MNDKSPKIQTPRTLNGKQSLAAASLKAKTRKDSGFSLIELMIVVVIMLVIMAATFSLMQGTMTTANANYEMTTAAQGLRNSQEFLTRDILVAGDGRRHDRPHGHEHCGWHDDPG